MSEDERRANGEIGVAIASKEVILSAGAVGSPQLLLLSGIAAIVQARPFRMRS